jgi:hypothetical protein
LLGLLVVLAVGTTLGASSQASPGRYRAAPGFGWFRAAPPPSSWKAVALPSGGAILSYPPSLARIHGDNHSVSIGKRDRSGRVLVYLNATPKQGAETLADWVEFRLTHNRVESNAVHEDAHASRLTFRTGEGSCVIDDYRSRVVVNHYREIACFVKGRATASVIVAAALQSQWARAENDLERAVEAYLVT